MHRVGNRDLQAPPDFAALLQSLAEPQESDGPGYGDCRHHEYPDDMHLALLSLAFTDETPAEARREKWG